MRPSARLSVRGELAALSRKTVLTAALFASACAGWWRRSPNPPPAISAAFDIITAAEIERTKTSTVYDAVRRLRPGWFATRGRISLEHEPATAIVVIMNRQVIGGVDELRSMSVLGVVAIRRLTAADIYQRSGTPAPGGGIEVVRSP